MRIIMWDTYSCKPTFVQLIPIFFTSSQFPANFSHSERKKHVLLASCSLGVFVPFCTSAKYFETPIATDTEAKITTNKCIREDKVDVRFSIYIQFPNTAIKIAAHEKCRMLNVINRTFTMLFLHRRNCGEASRLE